MAGPVVGAGFLLFALAVKHLPVFPKEEMPPAGADPVLLRRRPALSQGVLAALWGLMLVGIAGVFLSTPDRAAADPAAPEQAVAAQAETLRLPEPYTFPATGDSPDR